MSNKVAEFLKQYAIDQKFNIFDSMYGSIDLGNTPSIIQSSGAVYGIWVKTEISPSKHIAEIPNYPSWYPVYWGKDISPVSRMKAHVQGHANGNINLPEIYEVQGKPLIFGAILVSNYLEFESLLHSQFPPFKGTNATGRVGSVIHVSN